MLIQTLIMVSKQCSLFVRSVPLWKTHAITNRRKVIADKPSRFKTECHSNPSSIDNQVRVSRPNHFPSLRIAKYGIDVARIHKRKDKVVLTSVRDFQIVKRLTGLWFFSSHPCLIRKFARRPGDERHTINAPIFLSHFVSGQSSLRKRVNQLACETPIVAVQCFESSEIVVVKFFETTDN